MLTPNSPTTKKKCNDPCGVLPESSGVGVGGERLTEWHFLQACQPGEPFPHVHVNKGYKTARPRPPAAAPCHSHQTPAAAYRKGGLTVAIERGGRHAKMTAHIHQQGLTKMPRAIKKTGSDMHITIIRHMNNSGSESISNTQLTMN